ncbi:hypothetical protein ERO13_D13G213800v2 [Gossypium hirsutum]|uniref:Multiple organellar RNA editing factor 3, mitochondrial n=1 Tax=Gossypium hirsutum TaxID=3635 RepID=A0A1U8N332_GOSHI|nr:multiple organellar RNA editing factor 3, mitochondrial [Gossypium hirsutum]KAG4113289.1 hypothetical protein ERO13_D13G213800v2 [Gossypium hirsutum]
MACLNARRSLSTLLSRALTASSSSSFPSRSRLTVALLNKTPVFIPEATKILTRTKTSGSGYSPLNDPSPKSSSPRPSVLLDDSSYEHWLIILEFPERPKPLEEEMIDAYVKTLASVVGSEEEAKKRIYSVCTTRYTGFRAFFSEHLVEKLGVLPRVRWVLPVRYCSRDHYYAGDLFVDGKVFHRPQFPWVGVPNSSHRVGGCGDHELWLITFEFREEPSLEEKIDFYVKTLASVVGSEEEAKRRIYAVGGRLTRYTGFRAVMSEEMAYELEGFPLVKGIYRDSQDEYDEDFDGGHLLVDGKVVLRPTSSSKKIWCLTRLVPLVVDQVLNDIYIRKMDETGTEG